MRGLALVNVMSERTLRVKRDFVTNDIGIYLDPPRITI